MKKLIFLLTILMLYSIPQSGAQIMQLNGLRAVKDTLTSEHINLLDKILAGTDTTKNTHLDLLARILAVRDTTSNTHLDLLSRILAVRDTTSNTHLDLLSRVLAVRDTTSNTHSNLLSKILAGTDSTKNTHTNLLARIIAGTDTLTDVHEVLKIFQSATGDTLTNIHAKLETRTKDLPDTLTAIHSKIETKANSLGDTLTDVHEKVEIIKINLYGSTKVATTTENFYQIAGLYTLFTGTTADVILESIVMRNAAVDCSDDTGGFTGISIQTDDVTPTVFVSQATGVKANLTSEAQIAWTGSAIIKLGTIIKLTIYGAASDATCSVDLVVVYRSTGTGTGSLVP